MRSTVVTSGSLFLILALVPHVFAVPIPVNNPSFEENVLNCDGGSNCFDAEIPGWTITVSSRTATFKPALGPDEEFVSLPDGLNVAALGNEQGGAGISQVLTAVVAPNTVYTLQVSVGHREDFAFSQYTVTLEAGDTVLASGSSLLPPAGMFLTDTLIFASGTTPDTLGEQLLIRLVATGRTSTRAAGQANFDLVLLDASSELPRATPTPESSERTPTPTIGPRACPGDCDGDGAVGITELLTGVNIALGRQGVGFCASLDVNGDGAVDVHELVRSIVAALRGCEAGVVGLGRFSLLSSLPPSTPTG